ncbi:alpha/beta hydrolase [Mycolicibacterium sp. 018/SC-01/001]|uniref:alpha/beta fold hydrolase n=1 Tax=Mycolicibacterium sp. 018/SC-01/001 TaxID=2592069 RepID=UPI001180E65B|nr:alpha/beta hydrolase [Mycolicibacterium sp. 018/SC-01/001]TRW89136.1 alpha/beta hydrolase [Mycolicibacterium sp. 018/SC-01/001]
MSGPEGQPGVAAMMEDRFVDVAGGKLRVQVRRGGEPALVFLHYWGGSRRTWFPVIDLVDDRYAVVTFDQRGWGTSNALPGPFDIGQLAQDALRVIEGCVTGPYILVGHSMGGKVAQLMAAGRPTNLTGAVLVAPAPPKPAAIPIEQQQALERAYASRDSIIKSMDGPLTHVALPPALREQVVEDSSTGSDEARAAWPRQGIVHDIADAVTSIDVPVLVLVGSADQVEPPDVIEELLMPYIVTARIEVLPDAGHLLPLEAPDWLAHHIGAFAHEVAG